MRDLSHSLKLYMKEIPGLKSIYQKIKPTLEALHRVRYPTLSKKQFINHLKTAIENNIGYASAKIGKSQQHWMYYEIFLKKERADRITQFERDLLFHGLKQEGVFPAKTDFYLEFNKFYIEKVRNLDCLGIFYYPWELEMIRYYRLKCNLIYYPDQFPHKTWLDESYPIEEERCYLEYFKDKKLLLISPFAQLLKERATKDIFEGVWYKMELKWFYPIQVDALEFPYGFSSETHEKYHNVINLFEYIVSEIDKKDFDIALVSAAGLAIPIVSYIKSIGKIGIDLGGHQQILFGVLGKRWRNWQLWQEQLFNEYWIDMPAKYRPKETDVCDRGAYW